MAEQDLFLQSPESDEPQSEGDLDCVIIRKCLMLGFCPLGRNLDLCMRTQRDKIKSEAKMATIALD